MNKKIGILAIALLALVLVSGMASAQPTGANATRGASERAPDNTASTQLAESGNTTALNILALDTARRWQGFYGNVTGRISLADGSNNVLYNWNNLNPAGEIYAANHSSVTWTNVFCVNFSAPQREERINLSVLNRFLGLVTNDEQGLGESVNATFNQTFGDDGDTFQVGQRTFNNADNCSMVTLNVNSAYQTADYKETLLTDNSSIIFTTIIENSQTGFSGAPTDFQMLVGVNGTGAIRPYYFFVELS